MAVSRYTWCSVKNGGGPNEWTQDKTGGQYNLNHAFYVSLWKRKEKKKLKIHLNPSALVHVCKAADWDP